jgi:dolichol-phosphate mannosyltransferase
VTVIVPTRNEASNVAPLLARVAAALDGCTAEVLFVDDSDDETPAEVERVASSSVLPVRLLHRQPGERSGGLGGAVQAGLAASAATWVVVMDGDLQHPPETIPTLLAAGIGDDLDVVVASRYEGNGAADGLSSPFRHFVSRGATIAARTLFPRILANVSDPMSGFFAVRRDVVDPAALKPKGFKILLEILARSSARRVAEVPFTFADRVGGESKASGREALRYFRQLLVLRAAASRSWVWNLARFGLVGGSGVLVNLVVLHALLGRPGISNVVAAAVATELAIAWNFVLTEAWVFRGSREGRWFGRASAFWALNTAALAAQLPLADVITRTTGMDYLRATLIALLLLVLVRFVVCDKVLYRGRRRSAGHAS